MPLTKEEAMQNIDKIEKDLTTIGGSTSIYWRGVEFTWEALPLSKGGNLKRGNTYGIIDYRCDGIPLVTKVDVINEVIKSPELKQALKEATTFIQCTMCGKIIVGNEAINAFDDYTTEYKMVDNKCQIIKWLKDIWCKFGYTYEQYYEARKISSKLKNTYDPVLREALISEFNRVVNKPLNYHYDRINIILCPQCLENIYKGNYKKDKT